MKFVETRLKGVWIIDLEPIEDERGFFARSWCMKEFEKYGLNPKLVQCNISYNHKKGTIRGMHYQATPYEESKLVRCIRGSIYDVVIDLRPNSSTNRQWFAVKLSAENHKALYVPEGCAHGFQTMEDNTEVLYQMTEFYHPESVRGLRWDDPTFAIEWPCPEVISISERDSSYPLLNSK